MLRKFLSALGRNGIFLIAFVVGLGLMLSWYNSAARAPAKPGSTEKVSFEVKKGADLESIAADLEKKQILKHASSITFFITGLNPEEKKKTIREGEYELSPGMRPKEIFNVLTSGKIIEHSVTIPPGTTMKDVIKLLAATGLVTEPQITQAMTDRTLMVELEIPSTIPEGYLAPGTYVFSKPVRAEEMVIRIVQEGRKRMEAGIPHWDVRAKEIGFTPYQAIILASIIERESPKAEERGTMSSLFHNRLRIGMPLQSDATVIYGLPNFSGTLTKDDLKVPSPYNTYLNSGLPPTPLCNPVMESLKSALYPEDTDYLYAAPKPDGTHKFSSTYREHTLAMGN